MEAHEALQRHEQLGGEPGDLSRLAQQAALVVAVLAAFLALASFLANNAATEVITGETRAADTSARLEAIDTKTTIADSNTVLLKAVGTAASGSAQAQAVAKALALETRITKEFAPQERALTAEINDAHAKRDHAEDQHVIFELSVVALQIGIVLAGIAILARRRWLLGGGGLVGFVGVALLALGTIA